MESSVVQQIEEFYETETVLRACIVCDSEETLEQLTRDLEEKDHSVDVIMYDTIFDERMSFMNKLYMFRDSSRMIAMSYATWYVIKDHVETDVLPYQNVFITVNLETSLVHYVAGCLQDAAKRGFLMSDVKTHFLVLACE